MSVEKFGAGKVEILSALGKWNIKQGLIKRKSFDGGCKYDNGKWIDQIFI